MEDEVAAEQAAQEALEAREASANNSLLSPGISSIKSPASSGSSRLAKKTGNSGRQMKLEDMLDETAKVEEEEKFTGHSCLLVTWKTNPEVEKFKVKMIIQQLYSNKTIFTIRSSTWNKV